MLFLITLLGSMLFTRLVIFTSQYHKRYTNDNDFKGQQKFHKVSTPRIGGLAILISFIFGLYLMCLNGLISTSYIKDISAPLIIVFMAGFMEDITKKISPVQRSVMMLIALVVAVYLTKSLPLIHFTGSASLNHFVSRVPIVSVILTFFCVVGLINAYNIIDGYNGLAAITALFNVLGLAGIEHLVYDPLPVKFSFEFIAALLGFLVYNYPKGKIFMGDGGAYMLGFIIAVYSIRIIQVHASVISPFALLLMAIYPVTEVGFSVYRKKFLCNRSATQPDGLHLHMLIYKRCTDFSSDIRNPLVVKKMLILIVPQIFLGLLLRKSTGSCLLACIAYVYAYVTLYFRIVRFKTPLLLKSKLF